VKIRGTLVRPLELQQDRDGDRIDPAGVIFDPDAWYVIHRDFDYSYPPIGRAKIVREGDGSLSFEGEIYGDFTADPPFKAAVGVIGLSNKAWAKGLDIAESRLFTVGLVHEHADPHQPDIEVIE